MSESVSTATVPPPPKQVPPPPQRQLHHLAALRLQLAEWEAEDQCRSRGDGPSQGTVAKKTNAIFEIVAMTAVGLVCYGLAAKTDVFARLAGWADASIGLDAGAFALTLVVFGLSGAWIAHRGRRQCRAAIAEERRANEALHRGILERDRLAGDILRVSELERRRIRQSLYVGLGQRLSALACLGKILEQKLVVKKSVAEAAEAARLVELLDQATAETQDLAEGVYPTELETHGLAAALDSMADDTERRYGIFCRVACDPSPHLLDPSAEIHLYRIAQVALNHAVKRLQARHVLIHLTEVEGRLGLTVKARAQAPDLVESIDEAPLRVLRFRARQIGATLEVGQDTGGVQRLTCRMPAPPKQPKKAPQRESENLHSQEVSHSLSEMESADMQAAREVRV